MGNHINPSSKLFLPGQIAQAVLHLAVTVAHTLLGKKCVCVRARVCIGGWGWGLDSKKGRKNSDPNTQTHTHPDTWLLASLSFSLSLTRWKAQHTQSTISRGQGPGCAPPCLSEIVFGYLTCQV